MRCQTATSMQGLGRPVSLRAAAHRQAAPSCTFQVASTRHSVRGPETFPESFRGQKLVQKSRHERLVARWRESTVKVKASWGAPVEWSKATVLSSSPAATQLHRVVLDIGERGAGYTKPGQYVQVKVGDSKPGFFAIASPPDPNNQGAIELLIKNAGETASLLCGTAEGGEVDVSPVMGKGFPIDKIPANEYSTVLIFATGSGISPIKALIESGHLQASDRSEVSLYYGVKNQDALAYHDAIPEWQAGGVKVVPVYSDDGKGYVQQVFEKDQKPGDGSKVGAVLCGHKDMCTAVTELLTGMGVDKDKILLNF